MSEPTLFLPVRLELKVGPPSARPGDPPTSLYVRIYPDTLHILDHVEGFRRSEDVDEEFLARTFWDTCAADRCAEGTVLRAWTGLCASVSPLRALYLVRTSTPLNLAEVRSLGVAPALPTVGDAAPAATVPVRGLPDSWQVVAYQKDGTTTTASMVVPGPLEMGIPPVGDPSDPTWSALAWLFDYAAAERVGMAVELELAGTPAPEFGLDAITVAGISSDLALDEILEGHRVQSGLAFVGDGEATNTAEGHTPLDPWSAAALFPEVQALIHGARAGLPPTSNGQRWQQALRLTDPELLLHVPGAEVDRETLARTVQTEVKHTFLDPSLDHILGVGVPERVDADRVLMEFVPGFLRPAGPYAPLRVGEDLYGLLPCLHPDSWPRPGEPDSGLAAVLHNVRELFEEVSVRLEPHTEHPLDRVARVAHPTSYATHVWAPLATPPDVVADAELQRDSLQGIVEGAEHTDSWNATYGALNDWLAAVAAWIGSGRDPSLEPDWLRHPGQLHTLGMTVEQAIQANEEAALDLLFEAWFDLLKSKEIWPVWTNVELEDGSTWFSATRDAGRTSAAPDGASAAAFCKGSGSSKRRERGDRLTVIAAALSTLSARHRQLLLWKDEEPRVSEIIDMIWDAFRATFTRADAMDRILQQLTTGLGVTPSAAPSMSGVQPALADATTDAGTLADPGFSVMSDWRAFTQTELSGLRSIVDPALGWHVRAALGGVSYRLDAWITGLASSQLTQPYSRVGLGAWGVALDIPPLLSLSGSPRSEGYVLAPTTLHAATAAVLRSGYLAHQREAGHFSEDQDLANPLAVALSGRRTRRARAIVAAVREGHELGELLGRQVEEAMADAGEGASLGSLRDAIMGADTTPLDGLAVLEVLHRLRLDDAEQLSDEESAALPTLTEAVRALLERFADDVDAVSDLLRAEGVHHLLLRRLERAMPVLDAATPGGGAMPGDFEVVDPPATGARNQHQVLLAQEPGPDTAVMPARTLLARGLQAWCARWLDAPSCVFTLAHGESTATHSLESLGLTVLDAALLPFDTLRVLAAHHAGWPPDAAWVDGPPAWTSLLADLGRVVRGARPLADEEHGTLDRVAMVARVDAVLDRFDADMSLDEVVNIVPLSLDGGVLRTRAERLLAYQPLGVDLLAADASTAAAVGERFYQTWLGLSSRVEGLRERWRTAADAVADAPDPATRQERLDAQLEVGRELVAALFGGDLALPAVFDAAPTHAATGPSDLDPGGLGRVRPRLTPLATATLCARALEALGEGPGAPALHEHVGVGALDRSTTVYAGPCPTGAFDGYRLDAWAEVVPDDTVTTGLALHVDVPAAKPPAALLLAPPPRGGPFDAVSASELVAEVIALIRLRGVGPNELAAVPGLGPDAGFLPATHRSTP